MAIERNEKKVTIVFTPHFGGSESAVRRHQQMAKELGCDSVFVPYTFGPREQIPTVIKSMSQGIRYLWQRELTSTLDRVPGDKIIFSFSFPSCAALQMIAENPRPDVKGWISDGGPFLFPWECMGNYFRHENPELNFWKHYVARTIGFFILGGPFYIFQMRRWIAKIPAAFPILSIRAGRDDLVPDYAIAAVFSSRQDLNLHVLELKEAEHLLGLKSFPDIYKSAVKDLLLGLKS